MTDSPSKEAKLQALKIAIEQIEKLATAAPAMQ
jgi:hypothetical protein